MAWAHRFLDLFRLAILDTGWLLPATLALVGATILALRVRRPDGSRESLPLPLLWLFLVPIACLVFAACTYGFGKGADGQAWPSIVLNLLPLVHATLAIWLIRRYRHAPPMAYVGLLTLGALSLVWLGLSWFVGAMAIVDDWV